MVVVHGTVILTSIRMKTSLIEISLHLLDRGPMLGVKVNSRSNDRQVRGVYIVFIQCYGVKKRKLCTYFISTEQTPIQFIENIQGRVWPLLNI